MDMTKHLRRWLNLDSLRLEFDGRYEGRISDVIEEKLNNHFKGEKGLEPVLVFSDGWRLCPNLSQRRALIEFWGKDTNDWIGRELVVFLSLVEKRHPKTNEVVRTTWEKRVCLPAAAVSFRREA